MTDRKNKYSHIIWDWNGTLLNDAWLCVDVMNGMLKEYSLPLSTLEDYREVFDFPVREYYRKLGFDFSVHPFEKVGMDWMVLYNERQKEASLHEGAQEVLQFIRERGYRQSILSAREQNELRKETGEMGVSGYFDHVFGLDDHYAHGKTDVGRRLLEVLGAPLQSLLFIGDTLHDAEVAYELGIDCILIPNGHQSHLRLLSSGVPVISEIGELRTLI